MARESWSSEYQYDNSSQYVTGNKRPLDDTGQDEIYQEKRSWPVGWSFGLSSGHVTNFTNESLLTQPYTIECLSSSPAQPYEEVSDLRESQSGFPSYDQGHDDLLMDWTIDYAQNPMPDLTSCSMMVRDGQSIQIKDSHEFTNLARNDDASAFSARSLEPYDSHDMFEASSLLDNFNSSKARDTSESLMKSPMDSLLASASSAFDQIGTGDSQALEEQSSSCATGSPLGDSSIYQIEATTTDSEEDGSQFDVCLGVLYHTITTSSVQKGDNGDIPIELRPSGNIVTLHCKNTSRYVGLLTDEAYCKLLAQYQVEISAMLSPSLESSQKKTAKAKDPILRSRKYPLRIVLYSHSKDKEAIASLLSDAGLYLQQPSIDECDRDVQYDNPHYLIRPGSYMPMLHGCSDAIDGNDDLMTTALHETRKNQVMRIFNSVGDIRISSYASQSLRVATPLKEHQHKAVAFMVEKERGVLTDPQYPPLWRNVSNAVESKRYRHAITGTLDDAPRPALGGILADEMGLGKSLSLLALICTGLDAVGDLEMFSSPNKPDQTFTTLIVTPKSTIPGWRNQIERHIQPGHLRLTLYHGPRRKSSSNRLRESDVVITTYETLRVEWETKGPLISEKWYRVVLDEAHHIRNRSSQIFSAACALHSQSRWCLTGTPIHNGLDDFGALLSFVGIAPFLNKSAFASWISSAVMSGKPEGLDRMRKLIEATCLRRTKVMVKDTCVLPKRIERIETVHLTPEHRNLYEFFRKMTTEIASGQATRKTPSIEARERQNQPKIFALISILRLICNHGVDLLPATAIKLWQSRDVAPADWHSLESVAAVCRICGIGIDDSNPSVQHQRTAPIDTDICNDCSIEPDALGENDTPASSRSGYDSVLNVGLNQQEPAIQSSSAKVQALLRSLAALRQNQTESHRLRPTKSVIFSVWTKMLDLVQRALQAHGFIFERIDGQSSLDARSRAISNFETDPHCTIMLASIGSTGEGVDLKVANNVYIMEPHWNPMAEAQAVDRVHRIGQDRDVCVIRFMVKDSIETYVRWLQLDKIKLIDRSVGAADTRTLQEIDDTRFNKLRDILQCS